MLFPWLPRWMRRRPPVRVPTILQMEAVECGAAALGMVLAHHGRRVPLETLRTACGVSRDGSKASNLVRAARTYGLDAKGYKRQPEALAELPMPAILHWNFNHFLVLEGICDGRAWLNDPATGPRTVTMAEVDQAFTGVVLTFEPTDAFEPGGTAPSVVRALTDRLRGAERGLAFVALAGLALVVPGLVEPAFARIFIDDILIDGAHDWIQPLLWAMGATALLAAGLTWLRQTYLMRMEMKIALGTSARFVWHVLRLPVAFFTQRSPGDLASRIAINDRVARLLSGQLGTSALNALVIVFYAALMVQYDALLTAVTVAVAGGNLLALHLVSRRRVDLNQRLLQERGKLMGTAMGGLQTMETLKATGGASDFFARWAGHFAQVTTAEQALGRTTLVLGVVPPLLTAVGTALLLGLGGVRIIDGALSIGGLVAFQVLAQRFTGPVNQLVALGSTLQEAAGDVARLDDVLAHPLDPTAPGATGRTADPTVSPDAAEGGSSPRMARRLAGTLALENVTFGYSPLDPPLIEDFTLTLTPGMRVALVGGSGSGKSTIARLVCGLHVPWEGTIRFDGLPREEVPPDVLVSSFAYVDQRITLFEGTVRENLTLWDPTVTEPDVIRAAKDACIHEAITARPGGYESRVEEGGRNFSGGQRQRLEIARALVQTPTVLVLDEATSALDPATEACIDAHLRRRGCTCLIIAHRLSTIRDADAILVLDRGRVVQHGTHTTLAATDGPYRRLLDDIG